MKTITLVVAALLLSSNFAMARCPAGTSYQCTQGFNGKVICGCR